MFSDYYLSLAPLLLDSWVSDDQNEGFSRFLANVKNYCVKLILVIVRDDDYNSKSYLTQNLFSL